MQSERGDGAGAGVLVAVGVVVALLFLGLIGAGFLFFRVSSQNIQLDVQNAEKAMRMEAWFALQEELKAAGPTPGTLDRLVVEHSDTELLFRWQDGSWVYRLREGDRLSVVFGRDRSAPELGANAIFQFLPPSVQIFYPALLVVGSGSARFFEDIDTGRLESLSSRFLEQNESWEAVLLDLTGKSTLEEVLLEK